MAYSSIYELPSAVRNSLNEADQRKWMDTYNEINPKSKGDIFKAYKETWHKCADLPSAFTFEIVAGADVIDNQGEMIAVNSILKRMPDFIAAGGPVQHEHKNYQIATIYDYAPMKLPDGTNAMTVYGAVFGNNPVTREARRKFKKGLNSISVAGEADMGSYICQGGRCGTKRNVNTLMEFSLCSVPANPICKLVSSHEGSNKGFAKSGEMMSIPVRGVKFHGGEECPTCPIERLVSDLRTSGFDAVATKGGAHLLMDNSTFAKAMPVLDEMNIHAIRYGDDVLLMPMNMLIEKSFKEGYEGGYIDLDGHILSSITKSQFETLAERDVLMESDDGFILKPFYNTNV